MTSYLKLCSIALCSTKIVHKANGNCACGFILMEVSTWSQAVKACKANGGRLAEIYNKLENNDIKSFLVSFQSFWRVIICKYAFSWIILMLRFSVTYSAVQIRQTIKINNFVPQYSTGIQISPNN